MSDSGETEYSGGFVPFLQTDGDVLFRESGSLAIIAGGNVNFREAGTGFLVAGGDVSLSYGGAGTVIAGGGAELSESTVGQMATVEANVTGGRIGLLLAGRANLQQSEVLISAQQAAILGVVGGFVVFLLTKLFGRD